MEIIPSPTPQPRILIFDHSQDVADVLAMRFVHHGCETKRLDTLENLSAEALSFGPDLILLDVEMHGASGFRAGPATSTRAQTFRYVARRLGR